MRKSYIKTTILALMLFSLSLPLFVGCGGGSDIVIDHSRTQLYVANYNGGIGSKWLTNLSQRFEELYEDVSFEEGKKGVQIVVDNDKAPFEAPQVLQSIKTSNYEVYFTGDKYMDFVSQNLLLDITDIVTENLTQKFGENNTIEKKLSDTLKEYYNHNGKYYALPHYDAFLGVSYDAALFNTKKLYFAKNGGWTNFAGERAAGPDGIEGTYDDGLPATFEDFFQLCQRMKNQLNIEPLSWTGMHSQVYSTFLLKSIWADYEGVDRANLEYNIGSIPDKNTASLIASFNGDQPVLEDVVITANNYKELSRQPGRYYGLKFWEEIVKNNYYFGRSTNVSQSHVEAQADYLESTFTDKPIAMIIEGSWWLNEARIAGTFDNMKGYGEDASYENRQIGFLPMPKATADKVGEKTTLYNSLSSCFINGNLTQKPHKIPLAKAFLQFANTAESLNAFTLDTGTTKSLKYDIDSQVYANLDFYTKSLIDIVQSADVVYADVYPDNASRTKASAHWLEFYYGYSVVGGQTQNIFLNAMIHDRVPAKDYFLGMRSYLG